MESEVKATKQCLLSVSVKQRHEAVAVDPVLPAHSEIIIGYLPRLARISQHAFVLLPITTSILGVDGKER